MKLKTESGEYDAKFEHGFSMLHGKKYTRVTFCSSYGLLTQGRANLAAGDRFVKSYGRKLALKRAIASLPREERGQIWKAYFAVIGGVK